VVIVQPELRQFPRIPVNYRVKLVSPDRIIAYSSAIDISMGGILVNGQDRLPVGVECGVAILLENADTGKRVVTRGTVVRSDAYGMALRFSKELDPASSHALKMLIRSLCAGADQPNQSQPGAHA
jgi:hypothetical protein